MDQAEKLQLIDVEVANELHCGQLGHHLREREKQRGEFMNAKLCARTSGWGGALSASPCPVSHQRRSCVGCAAVPGRPSPGVSELSGLLLATAGLQRRSWNVS